MTDLNLSSKYSNKIAKRFSTASFLAGNVSNEYDFAGVKSLVIYTPKTVDLTDYDRTAAVNRFGTPVEMEDSIQELVMSQDKGFSITIDKGNNDDQMMIKEAGKMLNLQIAEKVVPWMDKYALGQFIKQAGTIAGTAEAPTEDTIIGDIFAAATVLDNEMVPAENRFLYIKASVYNMLRQAKEFMGADSLMEKNLAKGVVGQIADMRVIKMPDSYFPANAYFLIAYKDSVIMPNKIKTARVLHEVPGLDGALLEGRNYFDAFVLGAKAMGVYALVDAAYICATPTIVVGENTATIECSVENAEIKYTLDGTDPRYSKSAKIYSGAIENLLDGDVVKAYAVKDGMFASAVAVGA